MDYTSLIKEVNSPELVKALRHCNGPSFLTCRECQYNNNMLTCPYKMLRDAAAAIEALQAEAGQWKAAVKGQEDGIKVLQAEVERLQVDLDAAYALMEVQDG